MTEPDIDNYGPEFSGGYRYAHDELRYWLTQIRDSYDGTSDPAWSAYETVLEKIKELRQGLYDG